MTSKTRYVMCGEAAGDQVDAADVLRLRNLEPNRNVNLHIDDISRSLYRDVPPQFLDLVEIATFVYARLLPFCSTTQQEPGRVEAGP